MSKNGKTDFRFFMPLAKVDKKKRTVSGYASTPTKDMDGEVVTLDAVKSALPSYMEWRNIREMHRLSAVGTTQEAHVDGRGLFITAKISDDAAWQKCLDSVYKGFSIGGRKLEKVGDKITEIELVEISLVDRPNNPDCRISVMKSAKPVSDEGATLIEPKVKNPRDRALKKMAQVVELLTKADVGNAQISPNDDETQNNKAVGTDDDAPNGGDAPYGNVDYADPGYQADKKKRYPIDTKKHVKAALSYINQADNASKYSSADLAKIKAKINAAAKKFGIGKKKIAKIVAKAAGEVKIEVQAIDEKSLAKAIAAMDLRPTIAAAQTRRDPLALRKGMGTVGTMSYTFDSLREVQRRLMMEAKREGGDMKDKALAKRVGALARELAVVIGQKAEHEGTEALDLSDADDQYLSTTLGEGFTMSAKTASLKGDDELTKVLTRILAKAAPKTDDDDDDEDDAGPRKLTAKMRKNMKMAKRSVKECSAAIEGAHKLLKAGYLAKEALVKAGKVEPGDGFDFIAAMEAMQKAYAEIDKLGTFAKSVRLDLKKMASGLGPADGGVDSFGAKNLSITDLSRASPGGGTNGSEPPLYPADGSVYPGKAAGVADDNPLLKYADKDGRVPIAIAELLQKNASLEGETTALRNMPRGGARPAVFDLTKVGNGAFADATGKADVQKALFTDVNPMDLSSQDENTRNSAAARVAGNFILSGHFGKSIVDPSFRGAAGSRA